MVESRSLFYNNKFYQYKLSRKSIKRINLRINDEGIITVSAPNFVTVKDVENFMYMNIEFIEKHIAKRKNSTKFNVNSGVVSLFGVELEIIKYLASKNSIKLENDKMIIHYKNHDDIKKLIKKVLKKSADLYFQKRLDYLSEKMGIPYNSFKVKWLKTKWGHCDSNKDIVLNYKLISYDKELIDYVIIHELCHVIFMNHSNDFWQLVETYCPNWKQCRQQLKM